MGKVWKEVSGLHRTPRELAFLLREYAQRLYLIRAIERTGGDAQALAPLKADLEALERVIRMVEVPEPIDLSKVRPKQPYKKRAVPYGQLGRTILDVLSKARGEALHTTVISRHVLARHGLPADRAGQKRARRSVISTLNELKAQGRVVRLASSSPNEQARWRRA